MSRPYRVGQVWRFGTLEDGFTWVVVRPHEHGPAAHWCLVLESSGTWVDDHPPGKVVDWYELRPWESEKGWERLA